MVGGYSVGRHLKFLNKVGEEVPYIHIIIILMICASRATRPEYGFGYR